MTIQNIALKQSLKWGLGNVTLDSIAEEANLPLEDVQEVASNALDAVMGTTLDNMAELMGKMVAKSTGGSMMDHFLDVYYDWALVQQQDSMFVENQAMLHQLIDQDLVVQGAYSRRLMERGDTIGDIAAAVNGWDSGDLRAHVIGGLVNSFLWSVTQWMMRGNANRFTDALVQGRYALDEIIIGEDLHSIAQKKLAARDQQ